MGARGEIPPRRSDAKLEAMRIACTAHVHALFSSARDLRIIGFTQLKKTERGRTRAPKLQALAQEIMISYRKQLFF